MKPELDILLVKTRDEAELREAFSVRGASKLSGINAPVDPSERASFLREYGRNLDDEATRAVLAAWKGACYSIEASSSGLAELAAAAAEIARRTDGYIVNLDGLYGLPIGLYSPDEIERASQRLVSA